MLRSYALRRPHRRFLYLVYNKSVQQDQQMAFAHAGARNVTIMTMAGLAFKATFPTHRGQLRPEMTATQARLLLQQQQRGSWTLGDAALAGKVLAEFCGSATTEVTSTLRDPVKRRRAVEGAQLLFAALTAPGGRPTHDVYTKQFALSQQRTTVFGSYDVVMVDEAQDLTEAQLSIVLGMSCFALIVVFDTHQTIYQHFGATGNLLSGMTPTYERRLSRSYRFGEPLDALATHVVRFFKHDSDPSSRNFLVRGAAKWKKTVISTDFSYDVALLSKGHPQDALLLQAEHGSKRQLAILSRHNATLFSEVAVVVERYPSLRISFVGGLGSACGDGGLAVLVDVSQFVRGCRDQCDALWLRQWPGSIDKFRLWVERKHHPMLRVLSIVDSLGPDRVIRVARRAQDVATHPTEADIIFSTVHKAKGLGWPQVRLLGDIIGHEKEPPPDWAWVGPGGTNTSERSFFTQADDANLLYTALTRAKAVLYIDPATAAWLRPVALHAAQDASIPDCLLHDPLLTASTAFSPSSSSSSDLDDDDDRSSPVVDVVLCCTCRQPHDGTPMIGCAGENCPIGWFHARCVGEPPADHYDDPWLCPSCAAPAPAPSPRRKKLRPLGSS